MSGLDTMMILLGAAALVDRLMRLIELLDRPRDGRRDYDARRDIA
nr:MAG TPA: hypothetical protein [Caudoviricetes sp.]